MPIIDLPIEQLYTYQGRNPRPTDFDAYWDRALAEMKAVDPQIKIEPHAFNAPFAECFDLTFTGVQGARLYAKYMRPKNADQPHPGMVFLHGYTGNSGEWSERLSWVARGYSIIALDCRGQGGRSEDVGGHLGNTLRGHIIRGIDGPVDNLIFRQVFLDCAQVAGILMNMPEVDATRVGVTGGSQGGALTIACAALEPRLKLAAPVYPFLCDYKRVWEMDLAQAAYEDIRSYFRWFDPLHEREEELFTKLGYIDIQFLAPRVKAEVLWTIGLMDTICPPSTQFAAYNKLTCKKQLAIYPDFGHEGIPTVSDKIYEFMAGL